jgi:hypothetical protein
MRGALALLVLAACGKPARPADEPVVANDAPAPDAVVPRTTGFCEPLLGIVDEPLGDTEEPIDGDAPTSVQLDGAGSCALESWSFTCRATYPSSDDADPAFEALVAALTACLAGDGWTMHEPDEDYFDPDRIWSTPGTWVIVRTERIGDEVEVVLQVQPEGEHDL